MPRRHPDISDLREYFECPICSEEMHGVKIFSCSTDHRICERCIGHERIKECPSCREDFAIVNPRRCLTAEKVAQLVLAQGRPGIEEQSS